MNDEKDTKKKKKGFLGSILRAKSLASRAKGLKASRDGDNGGSFAEEKRQSKLKLKSPIQIAEDVASVKLRRPSKHGPANGGAGAGAAWNNHEKVTTRDSRDISWNQEGPRRRNEAHALQAGGRGGNIRRVDGGSGTDMLYKANGDSVPRKKSRTMDPTAQPINYGQRSFRRRPRRPKPADEEDGFVGPGGGEGESDDDDDAEERVGTPQPPILTRWPPPGISSNDQLAPPYAMELIARGAPAYIGHKRAVPHAPAHYYALYATTSSTKPDDTDCMSIHESMTPLMTLRLQGAGRPTNPWETFEQPSCAFRYGFRPGTITLNQWVSMSSSLPPTIALRDPGILPRPMDLFRILERLKELQAGLEDDDETLLYRILYKRILRDPDRILSPHRTLDKQITDLLLVLSRPDWIDFTEPRNQVVTRFIFNAEYVNVAMYKKFFHQLLLSLELDLRIHSKQHGEWAKEKLLAQIPPTIRWNLALARRWRENVRVDGFGATPEQTNLRYKLKKRQVKVLKKFAQAMKWPNLDSTMENLRTHDEEFRLDLISSDAFAFFSGLVLPGPTFPFLIMNTLIDLDPDSATDNLALLSHTYPQCGFQYRNSHTYWSASSIVGKVLAPTCCSVAGWVGPARPTADLGRSQIARIRTRRPKHQDRRIGPEDVESMGERSDCLGPTAQSYPVIDYTLVVPDEDSFSVVDTVRIELLGFKPVVTMAEDTYANGPRLFDATVQFAIDGVSWPLRLMYDVYFVSAWPCSQPPHPLFFDYIYRVVKADEIVRVRDWGGLYYRNLRNDVSASARSSPAPPFYSMGFNEALDFIDDDGDDEKVLVVEAYGVPDNEVLARAWCSHWGLSAVVADIRKTW
ncbi:hypothetical protein UVI_02061610 [Ustilaginoidea virens]|uniref:VTC domain-containing protein n=1 Tax=Ustilaginoidea virens TaxID=1159556 RepID=A0A1B5L638_USTVR|nr:hypothetical protein UVI_02061610 [Ustilaginoidea virens]